MINRLLFVILISTAVLLSSNVFSAEPLKSSELDTIEPEEYEIFNAVLDKYHALVSLEKTTMSEKKLDNADVTHLKRLSVHVDAYLTGDFNKKNSRSYELEKRFFKKRYFMDESYQSFPGSGKESVGISRVGFNKEKDRALIFVRYKSITPPEAFYEEGNFVYLEKKEGKWVAIKTVMASQRYY
ncbi:MAG: hypothetical protein QMD44_02980 [Thermodesulfovibrionales bacterium]|jgi:hypothetical protein|nr:hypothetical protein [Thermodesulfovibrionales bacterium]